jgi:hypothetical protein
MQRVQIPLADFPYMLPSGRIYHGQRFVYSPIATPLVAAGACVYRCGRFGGISGIYIYPYWNIPIPAVISLVLMDGPYMGWQRHCKRRGWNIPIVCKL